VKTYTLFDEVEFEEYKSLCEFSNQLYADALYGKVPDIETMKRLLNKTGVFPVLGKTMEPA